MYSRSESAGFRRMLPLPAAVRPRLDAYESRVLPYKGSSSTADETFSRANSEMSRNRMRHARWSRRLRLFFAHAWRSCLVVECNQNHVGGHQPSVMYVLLQCFHLVRYPMLNATACIVVLAIPSKPRQLEVRSLRDQYRDSRG